MGMVCLGLYCLSCHCLPSHHQRPRSCCQQGRKDQGILRCSRWIHLHSLDHLPNVSLQWNSFNSKLTNSSVWGVADGSRILGVDAEIISYAVLDVLAKPVFGFWLLFTHDSMASTSPSLGGFWSEGWGSQGSIRVGDDDEA